MSTQQIPAIIQEMVRRIVERFDPERILLFGSHARGTAGSDSDVDLLVVLETAGSKRSLRRQIRCALHRMGVAKDVVVVTPEEFARHQRMPGTVVEPVAREGVPLYERAG